MKTTVKEGLVITGMQVYRWRYDGFSEYFSLLSLDENCISTRTISQERFDSVGVEKLVKRELAALGMPGNTLPEFLAGMKVTYNERDEDAEVPVEAMPLEVIWAELRRALKIEDYESAILYRNELMRRKAL